MQAGAPIIASNCGGNPELIENNKTGILVEYNNQEQLLTACIKILSDKSLADNLANNVREKAKEFKWSEVVEKTTGVIKSLL